MKETLNKLKEIPDESIDLIITEETKKFAESGLCKELLIEIYRVSKNQVFWKPDKLCMSYLMHGKAPWMAHSIAKGRQQIISSIALTELKEGKILDPFNTNPQLERVCKEKGFEYIRL